MCRGTKTEMLVQEFLHNVICADRSSVRSACGSACAHKPFIFTVALNKAVPLMYNALASGEMLPNR
ncbi:type VI secretion system tube protein Hcp [Escherichia coli]|uniref:type VI secretion system tube protein Hcp n=1 Tax=Escherichia coli TaxID=562 RepID=UPI0035A5FE52